MTARVVFAHPDRLRQFRVTAGAMADGLAVRRESLHAAVAGYEGSTEPLYRADCRAALEGVRALGVALRELGEWVGRVGDAFETLPEIDGVHLGRLERLVAALPPELRTDDDWAAAGGGSVGSRARPSRGRGLQPNPGATAATMFLGAVDVGGGLQLLAQGLAEGRARADAERDRGALDRLARGAIDGGASVAGTVGGSNLGQATGAAVCAEAPALVPACGAVGSAIGGALGRRAGEWVTDRVLGEEPEPWERDPGRLANEIAELDPAEVEALEPMVEQAREESADRAGRHTDFVLDHPWMWNAG
jgi:hypothetical protein